MKLSKLKRQTDVSNLSFNFIGLLLGLLFTDHFSSKSVAIVNHSIFSLSLECCGLSLGLHGLSISKNVQFFKIYFIKNQLSAEIEPD
jgi:hypothetical protein